MQVDLTQDETDGEERHNEALREQDVAVVHLLQAAAAEQRHAEGTHGQQTGG